MAWRPIADGLFRIVDGLPRLLGGRRKSDGKIVFPCPQGAETAHYDIIDLREIGTLWSWTVQRFRPKTPYAGDDDERSFKPYAVGYVELPGQIIVEARLKIEDFGTLHIGMPMRLTLIPFRKDPDGTEIRTYAFEAA